MLTKLHTPFREGSSYDASTKGFLALLSGDADVVPFGVCTALLARGTRNYVGIFR